MKTWTFQELYDENEKISLGLQYTIAQRERLKALLSVMKRVMIEPTDVGFPEVVDTIFNTKAERCQDVFALLLSGAKQNGFFVEFGACDGIAANNTFTLEKNFGWKGILAEPDRFWKERLPENRSVMIDNRCVSSTTGGSLTFYQSDRPGNSSPDQTHAHLGGVTATYDVETVTLLDLLKTHNAPQFIDFLSVDTEGHEKEVFVNFDFDQYRFGFICVEEYESVAPEDSVQPIMERAGYKLIFPREHGRPIPMQITGVDMFFVHRDHPAAGWEYGV
ncbi:FkbM family methyltransferase [Rhizobium sp. PP-F2F-G38]|nr:FkbM family methyltransferase [Rhizobium sp. PP-F2F-G38]